MSLVWTIITSGLVSSLVTGFFNFLFKRNISKYQNQLLFDLQRKTHDFQLYTNKRHESYADLYSSLHETTDEIMKVTHSALQLPNFMHLTESEVDDYLEKREDSENLKSAIKDLYYQDLVILDKELKRIEIKWQWKKACDMKSKSYQNYTKSIIFQSSNVYEICENLFEQLQELLLVFEGFDFKHDDQDLINNKRKEIYSLRRYLRGEIQKELSVGYYSK
ncbi:hypothetical protein ACQ4XT_14120 [Halobacillus faecis]